MKRSKLIEEIAEAMLQRPSTFGGDKQEREEVRESTKIHRLKMADTALQVLEWNDLLNITEWDKEDWEKNEA